MNVDSGSDAWAFCKPAIGTPPQSKAPPVKKMHIQEAAGRALFLTTAYSDPANGQRACLE